MTETFSGNFTVGDVLAYDTYSSTYGAKHGSTYAAKVLDYVYVNPLTSDGTRTTDVKYWIVQHGRVVNGEFVPDKGNGVSFLKTDSLRSYGFTYMWVKPPSFKDGEFLISDKGVVFYHENKNQVWRVSGDDITSWGSMHASLASRTREHGELKVLKTAAGRSFKSHIED